MRFIARGVVRHGEGDSGLDRENGTGGVRRTGGTGGRSTASSGLQAAGRGPPAGSSHTQGDAFAGSGGTRDRQGATGRSCSEGRRRVEIRRSVYGIPPPSLRPVLYRCPRYSPTGPYGRIVQMRYDPVTFLKLSLRPGFRRKLRAR
jgi:hypothetical protein